jgi:hypothetical protein
MSLNLYKKSIRQITELCKNGTDEEKKEVKNNLFLMLEKLKTSKNSNHLHHTLYWKLSTLHDSIILE